MRILQDWNVRCFSWIRRYSSGYMKTGSLLKGRVIVTFEKGHKNTESVVVDTYRCKTAFAVMSACKLQTWNRNSTFIMITELFVVVHWSSMKVYVPSGDEEECSYGQAIQTFITFYYVVWTKIVLVLNLSLSLFLVHELIFAPDCTYFPSYVRSGPCCEQRTTARLWRSRRNFFFSARSKFVLWTMNNNDCSPIVNPPVLPYTIHQ
jgi:hypothetical protein